MIRGIARVVRQEGIVAGAFYLCSRYSGDPYLIQAITTAPDVEPTHAVVFDPGANDPISIMELEHTTYALMPEVSVRVDPPSMSGNAFTHNIRPSMMIVDDNVPYVVASLRYRGYSIINLSTGLIQQNGFTSTAWATFDRWQLVVDENGEEVPIASFGAQPGGE
jgi:hypothetical protein